jgi:hypothetical protein
VFKKLKHRYFVNRTKTEVKEVHNVFMEDTVIKATRRENTCSFQKKTGLSNY